MFFGFNGAVALPSPRDAILKTATQIKFNQKVKISMPDGFCVLSYYPDLKKIKKYCKEGYATVSVSGIKFADNQGSESVSSSARYAITATVSNYFKNSSSGLNLFITCSNSTENGPSYADGKAFNQLPAMSSDSGDALVGLPVGQSSSSCVKPVIWIVGDSKDNPADAKKAKTIWAAYIPIPSTVFAGH
jgi:hypothetical protein